MFSEIDNKLIKTVTKKSNEPLVLATYLSLFKFSVCIFKENVFEKRKHKVIPLNIF